nr:hypothetical protein [Microlunatus elymi]
MVEAAARCPGAGVVGLVVVEFGAELGGVSCRLEVGSPGPFRDVDEFEVGVGVDRPEQLGRDEAVGTGGEPGAFFPLGDERVDLVLANLEDVDERDRFAPEYAVVDMSGRGLS